MKNLKEILTILIHENKVSFNSPDDLSQFINDYIYSDRGLDDLQACISEWSDGEVPVYNGAILEAWRDNSGVRGATSRALGSIEASADVYELMASDLYFFCQREMQFDLDKLIELFEDIEA